MNGLELEQQIQEKPHQDYLRVAACTPAVRVGDCEYNGNQIADLYKQMSDDGVSVAAFPEMSITGYTIADLVQQKIILDKAEAELEKLAEQTEDSPAVMIVGLPLRFRGNIYNCAAVVADGEIKGIVPKSYLPNYNEFFEMRWYSSGLKIKDQTIAIGDKKVPFGTDLLFMVGNGVIGVEICEDLWAVQPPSDLQALNGANVIVNISASNELVGKADRRRQLVAAQAWKLISGYVYVSAGVHESTADTLFSGHNIISENGHTLAEGERFLREPSILMADIDLAALDFDRFNSTTFQSETGNDFRLIELGGINRTDDLMRDVPKLPYIPSDPNTLNERAEEIINIQSHALATTMEGAGIYNLTLGLSGGLDSTLMALVATKALGHLGYGPERLHTFTMPGMGSSDRTQTNADILAQALGTTHTQTPISDLSEQMLLAIEHDLGIQDVTFENVQARMRTAITMNQANQLGAIPLGTGDMSEIFNGYSTFNGDHMSIYNPNSGVPKTLVKYLVAWAADQPEMASAEAVLRDILATPVSPELKKEVEGEISQVTEEVVGPYDLQDFISHQIKRHGTPAEKIGYLARVAFEGEYTDAEIAKWLPIIINRFTSYQVKRESAPNGVKIGPVSWSQRADWRMAPNTSKNWAW